MASTRASAFLPAGGRGRELRHDEIPHGGLVARGAEAFRQLPDDLFHVILLQLGAVHDGPRRRQRLPRRATVPSKSPSFMMAAGEWM